VAADGVVVVVQGCRFESSRLQSVTEAGLSMSAHTSSAAVSVSEPDHTQSTLRL
jgi:hypothetical protein